jgi:esterase/lipase
MELLPDIKYIKCPIFIITSTDDTLVPAAHSERIYQNIGHKDREILFIKGQHN